MNLRHLGRRRAKHRFSCVVCMAQRALRRLDATSERYHHGRLVSPTSAGPVAYRRISEPHRTAMLTLLHDIEAETATEDVAPDPPRRWPSDFMSNPVGSTHDLRRARRDLERRKRA